MHLIEVLFGIGKDLTVLQMSCRGIAVFLISLVFIRISGRRSFGLHTPLDNIITILLGAILSRAVVGASPFGSVILTSFIIVLMHRAFAWVLISNPRFSKLVQGDKICVYNNGNFISRNMDKGLVCKEDIMQGIRESALTDDISKIKTVYIERNGIVSSVKSE